MMDGSSSILCGNANAGSSLQRALLDEGNYTVNPEANGKHNNPIWIPIAVLIARRVGGREERSGGSRRAEGRTQQWEQRLWGRWRVKGERWKRCGQRQWSDMS